VHVNANALLDCSFPAKYQVDANVGVSTGSCIPPLACTATLAAQHCKASEVVHVCSLYNRQAAAMATSFAKVADTLGDALSYESPPLTVGVFGKWGSGKSRTLRLIRSKLLVNSVNIQRNVSFRKSW